MIDCISIIQSAERLGAELLEDGDDIRVKKGKYLPDSITASIGDNKREILAILEMNGELALWLPFRGNSTLLL